MATIATHMPHASGIPLGGLGTGTVEIKPDGSLSEWQIFNLGPWASVPTAAGCSGKAMPPGGLSFIVRTESGSGEPVLRRLSLRPGQHDLYRLPWLKSVEAIRMDGRFPEARLTYYDRDLPVEIEACFFSPFVPHDVRTSGTPGFYMTFRLTNRGNEPVRASLLALLNNPLAWQTQDRRLVNGIDSSDQTTRLTMRTCPRDDSGASVGSLSLAATGGECSWLTGAFQLFVRGRRLVHAPFANTYLGLVHDFRTRGRLPSLAGGRSPAKLLAESAEEIIAMPVARKQALACELRGYAFAESLWRLVEEAQALHLQTEDGTTDFLLATRNALDQFAGEDRTGQAWGDGALCSAVSLAPGEATDILFTLSWHFPNHYSESGERIGHMYENWFEDAEQANRFLVDSYPTTSDRVRRFCDTLYDTTLDPRMADAWGGQLTTLIKSSWWTRSGDFAIWEGLGCCGHHTTDITYQGSFGLLALFPELQKGQMEMGARFQREDGRVHHLFKPDLQTIDDQFDRVDMNPQFVMLVCRDYLWTGDLDYLKRLWPHVVKAMDSTALLDQDGDGLLDHDTRRNTYDLWDFRGAPTYINSLWLSALHAATRMAGELGDAAELARWDCVLKKGVASFETKLWNGRYYSLYVDGYERDEACMTDQLSGEWFNQVTGLGHVLSRQRVEQTLDSIMACNYSTEGGLANATYPPGTPPSLTTLGNIQARSPWSGVEYAMASLLLEFGKPCLAADIVNNIHKRYARGGSIWDHEECGGHYYRAMSSWAVLLSATGFKLDASRKRLTITPPGAPVRMRAPWVAPTAWGRFEQTQERFLLTCESGTLTLKALRLSLSPKAQCARHNQETPTYSTVETDGLVELRFAHPLTVREGDRLEIG